MNSTCWTMVNGARAGDPAQLSAFARCYEPVARAYLVARWRGGELRAVADDAVQECFIEMLRDGGALTGLDSTRAGGFRPFFYGVVRNVARRFEERAAGSRLRAESPPALQGPEEPAWATVFDHAWARSIMREAGRLMDERSRAGGPEARRRVDLLRARFQNGQPIRDMALLNNEDPTTLHRQYARARAEFRSALVDVIAWHGLESSDDVEQELQALLTALADPG